MIYVGLVLKWIIQLVEKYVCEVEVQLYGSGYCKLFCNMYGDKLVWLLGLFGYDCLCVIINLFMCMCYCMLCGCIGIEDKGMLGIQEQGFYFWFEVLGWVECDFKIVCGYWFVLGLIIIQGVYVIDIGVVWGGKFIVLQLDMDELCVVQVFGCDVFKLVFVL